MQLYILVLFILYQISILVKYIFLFICKMFFVVTFLT
nr:MAG TPA: hypothetical protein [Caudoviricetes sp.]